LYWGVRVYQKIYAGKNIGWNWTKTWWTTWQNHFVFYE